jgi:DDE superfamily endonuclease
MEDVLAVYMRPHDPDPRWSAWMRPPSNLSPKRACRSRWRKGAANLFMLFAPLEGRCHVKVTDRHTGLDYAEILKELADIHFPHAKAIVLLQDNVNIHSKVSLYEAFPVAEARGLVERFEWHFTPKHGSWLDLAESELD